jgi:protein-tyrosine phosphatase
MTVRILFLCTGNVCRSPFAAALLRARLDPSVRGFVDISSAGTRALAGYAMDSASAFVLRELGGDPDGHVARQFTPELMAADLVLAADGGQRAAALAAAPAALARTFTAREFARLGRELPAAGLATDPDDVRARIAAVAGRRGLGLPVGPGEDDIGDPFGAPLPVVRRSAAQIADAVGGIGQALGLTAATR